MSEKLTEVDKLLKKINHIYQDLGGETDPNQINSSSIKDKFEALKMEVNRGIQEIESLLNQKDQLTPDKVMEKHQINAKVEDKLKVINNKISDLRTEFKTFKKRKPKPTTEEIKTKEDFLDLYDRRYMYLKNRLEGIEVDDSDNKKDQEDIMKMEDLDKIASQKRGPDRELYEEEKAKMDEWDDRIKQQDQGLNMIHKDIKELKVDAKQIGRLNKEISKQVDTTKKQADKTEKNLETTNKKLKDMLEKLRGSDKICLDIVLVCICLGLIAVLYNLIKGQLDGGDDSTPVVADKRFLI